MSLFSSVALLTAASAASAVPLLNTRRPFAARNDDAGVFTVPYDLDVSYASPVNASLPNIVIFATGGTIAGSSSSSTDATHYTAGVIGVEALVDAVPLLLNISNIIGSQISNIGSQDMTPNITLKMAKLANEILCSSNSTTDGIVITHGTDTLEETAFFMDLTVNCEKPVVIVGAMRPATAISADGPGNLLEAVTLAANKNARGRGAMVVLNDRIGSAFYTEKTNGNTLDTFKAEEQGYLGGFLSFEPFFYYPASKPTFKHTFNISAVEVMPQVDILYGYQDFDWHLVGSSIYNGAQGIVFAGTGAGSVTTPSFPAFDAAVASGFPLVVSSKTNGGAVVSGNPWIGSGFLNPVKSRIQLQLAIATGLSFNETKALFEHTLNEFLA